MNWKTHICFISVLLFMSCQPKITADIVGKWTQTSTQNYTGVSLVDFVEFKSNGELVVKKFFNKDSLLQEQKGTYRLNKSTNRLVLKFDSVENDLEITLLDKNYLVFKLYGNNISYTRIEY